MKASVEFQNTGSVDVAITIMMPLAAWKYVKRDLQAESAPSHDVRVIITKAIEAAEARIEIGPTHAD